MTKLSLIFLVTLMNEKFKPKDPTPTLKLKHHWAYDGEDGPATWPLYYEHCGGTRQSPVNLRDSIVEYDYRLPKIELYNFDVYSQLTGNTILNITNNGHSASCAIKGDYYVDGGGLGGHYRTAEFHFHWGRDDSRGSEHADNGRKYPLEMHIVNYAEKYGNLSSAMKRPDGLAVLGIFFEVSRHDNPALEPIMSALGNIIHNADYHVINNCSVRSLLPNDLGSYYRYEGSLTTPPCYESVIWTVFAETQYISRRQLSALRKLEQHQHETHDNNGHAKKGRKFMVDNYRPLQKLNNRRIHKSFLGSFVRGAPIQLNGPSSGKKFVYPTSAGPSIGSQPVGFLGQQSTGGTAGSTSKDASRIMSALRDAQKNSLLVSEANPRFGNGGIQSSDSKGASHHSQHTMREGSTDVRQVSGQRPVRLTTPKPPYPFVTLISGQFLPPLLPGEQASSSSASFASGSEGPANPYAVPNPKTIITSRALEKPTSVQSVSSRKSVSSGNDQASVNTAPSYPSPHVSQVAPQQPQYNDWSQTYHYPQPQPQPQPEPAPPVFLQQSPQPVRVRSPYYYNYNMNNNEAQPYNYQANNFQGLNFGGLGELKKRKRRRSHKHVKYDKHHVHDENCGH